MRIGLRVSKFHRVKLRENNVMSDHHLKDFRPLFVPAVE